MAAPKKKSEAIRVRNTAGLYAQEEAFGPELMRMRNLADANGESWVLDSN